MAPAVVTFSVSSSAVALIALTLLATMQASELRLPRWTSWHEGACALRTEPFTPDAPRMPDLQASHASAWLAWDDVGLRVAVNVADATPSEAARASGAYMKDSVELFLAASAIGSDNLQVVISPGNEQTQPRAYIYDNRPQHLQNFPKAVTWKVTRTSNGYRVEAMLPWAAIGQAPRSGGMVFTRIFVNDDDGFGRRIRWAWPSADGAEFQSLRLSENLAASTTPGCTAWIGLDPHTGVCALHVLGIPELVGTRWSVKRGGAAIGELVLKAHGPLAAASLPMLPGDGEPLTISGPHAQEIVLADVSAKLAASILLKANRPWKSTAGEAADVAFARLAFPQHIFEGSRFPNIQFANQERALRLFSTLPKISTRWFDAEGQLVQRPISPGIYGARTEMWLGKNPLVLEHIFFRLPDGCHAPPNDGEDAARILGFRLAGADATPSHADRISERWWHKIRKANGWAGTLPYKIHVPHSADSPAGLPLIVHLHGSGQNNDAAAEETLALLSKLAGSEAIIVYPMSPTAWRGPLVGELIDKIIVKYPVDHDRVSLLGFSMGGIGAWTVALDQPGRFSCVVPVGGRMGSPEDAARLRDVPVRMFNGAADPTTTPEEAEIMADSLRAVGGRVELFLLPGLSHGDSQKAAYHHPGLISWMIAQKRKAP